MTELSFSPISFSKTSFTVQPAPDTGTGRGSSGNRLRERWRTRMAEIRRSVSRFFHHEPQPKPPLVPIPAAQPRVTTTILASPPTATTKLETINDKWTMPAIKEWKSGGAPIQTSVVASIPVPPPIIISESLASPVIQKIPHLEPYNVAEGEHIESQFVPLPKPRAKINSKAAAVLLHLMIISELEELV